MSGYYYLHENGELIYKPHGDPCDFRDSDLVRMFWPVDRTNRRNAWNILVEASAAGATPERVRELAEKWQCDDNDAEVYALHVGARLVREGDQWCATRRDFVNLQESDAGFGDTALQALAALCKTLGYVPMKMWGADFARLLLCPAAAEAAK